MVSQILKEAKKRKGVTNEWIAAQSSIPIGTVNRIIGGHGEDPRLSTLLPICLALDVDIKQLAPVLETLPPPAPAEKPVEVNTDALKLADKVMHKQQTEKKLLFYSLLAVIGATLLVFLIDVFTPSIGWVIY